MEFVDNKPIYIQIYDSICEKILSGEYTEESRIPSVREMGGEVGVNPNTIMRSYEKLSYEGIIFNKRGTGYFVSADARENILAAQRREFIENELPLIKKRIKLLGIDISELCK